MNVKSIEIFSRDKFLKEPRASKWRKVFNERKIMSIACLCCRHFVARARTTG